MSGVRGWALRARNVTVVRRGRGAVLRGVNLDLPAGHLHVVLGANGSGKSTLLEAIAGLVPLSEGELEVNGSARIVAQNPDHAFVLPTAGAEVAFGLWREDIGARDVRDRVRDALARVNLQGAGERAIQTLSGGQKQRLAIAVALVERPSLLLMDEVTSFLDPDNQEGVIRTVRAMVDDSGPAASGANNLSAIWVTHRKDELAYATSASVVEGGKLTPLRL